MIKPWAKLQPRTESLLGALVAAKVDSKTSLANQWKDDANFLLPEYCQWLPQELIREVKSKWPLK